MDPFKPAISIFSAVITVVMLASLPGNVEGRSRTRLPKSPTLGLQQAVSIALNRNLRIVDARLEVRERESQRRSAFSDFFPTIDLQYQATGARYRQPGNVSALAAAHDSRRSPPFLSSVSYPFRIDPYKSFSLTATLTQPLYTGGKLINDYKFARLGVDFSAIQVQVDRQDLILEVYEAYYGLLQSEKLLGVANESIRALEALRNQTVEFYKAGVVPKVDVLATEGQLAEARIQKTQSLADIETFKATLNLLLRYPQETPISIVQDLSYRPSQYRIPMIYTIAANNRLEIRQANISVEQAIALVRSSQADLLPSVNVQARGSRTNDDWNPVDREAVNDWRILGILSWSFDMFRNRETVQERRTSQARAFVAREQLVEDIMDEVKTAYEAMKRSESDIRDNRKAVEFRRENFRINQERYKEQVATYIEVLDAQRQLSLSQGDYYVSLMGYKINRAILERQMGILRD